MSLESCSPAALAAMLGRGSAPVLYVLPDEWFPWADRAGAGGHRLWAVGGRIDATGALEAAFRRPIASEVVTLTLASVPVVRTPPDPAAQSPVWAIRVLAPATEQVIVAE